MSNLVSLSAEIWTISTSRPSPTRNWATLSGLPMVALSPMNWMSFSATFLIRSRARLSWLPRLLSASSCISSTMIHFTVFRWFLMVRPCRMACRVSGVVMSMSGGLCLM